MVLLLYGFGDELRLSELGRSPLPFRRPGKLERRLGRVGRSISVANALYVGRYTTSDIPRNDQHGKQDFCFKPACKQN